MDAKTLEEGKRRLALVGESTSIEEVSAASESLNIWLSLHAPALIAAAEAMQIVHAQHDETGRFWSGPRCNLPPRYAECPPPPGDAA